MASRTSQSVWTWPGGYWAGGREQEEEEEEVETEVEVDEGVCL